MFALARFPYGGSPIMSKDCDVKDFPKRMLPQKISFWKTSRWRASLNVYPNNEMWCVYIPDHCLTHCVRFGGLTTVAFTVLSVCNAVSGGR